MVETTADNKVLVREAVANILVQPLEAASVVLSSGPTILDSSVPIKVPTITGSTDPSWVKEAQLIPDHAVSFGELRLMPTDRASIKAICKVTNELLRMANVVGLDAILKQRLVSDVSNKLDTALLVGDGSNDSVTGILNQPGTQKAALDLKSPDTFLDAMAMAAAAEVTPNRLFMAGADLFAVRKLKDASGKYLLEADLTKDVTYRLFGVPVTPTNKLPAGTAILVNMADVVVVRDLNPSITMLTERYAEYDETGIRVVTRYDLGLLRPESVVVMKKAAG